MAHREITIRNNGPLSVADIDPALAATPIEVGECIGGRYSVIERLAEGGMAVVLLARHIELEENVAIKLLKPSFLSDTELVARFVREAKTTARIKSTYCVKIHDVGIDARRGPFMVMEYLEGEDLARLLQRTGPVEPAKLCEFAIQVCEALAVSHALGVVHRDLKPQNLFVTKSGNLEAIRVLDFGISKVALTGSGLRTELPLAETTSLLGSPMYMAPEQMRARGRSDDRSDIWSLGVTLYEASTGLMPFDTKNIPELCARILEETPKAPQEHNPDLPAALSRVIMWCLEKEPDRRPQHVGELARALLPFAPARSQLSLERILASVAGMAITLDPPPLNAGSAATPSIPCVPPLPEFVATPGTPWTSVARPEARASLPRWQWALACVALLSAGFFAVSRRGNQAHPEVLAALPSAPVWLPAPEPATVGVSSVSAPGLPATLHIRSSVPGARVLLRGAHSPLPYQATIAPGSAPESVEVTAPDHQGRRYWLVLSGQVELDVTLSRGHGVSIASDADARKAAAPPSSAPTALPPASRPGLDIRLER